MLYWTVISVTERSSKWRAEKDVRMKSDNDSDESSFTMQGALVPSLLRELDPHAAAEESACCN